MKKIHYHSECSFFAGCENMLAVLFNSDELEAAYNISFSFVYSAEYASGYARRVHSAVPLYPLYFFDVSDVSKLPRWIPLLGRRILMRLFRMMVHWPLLAYEVFALTSLFHKIKPDILMLGADWKNKKIIGKDLVKQIVFFKRINKYSSTKIINKIKKSRN